ncbi:unnamed protein product [Coccothraustes coccothraustes]
MSYPNPAFFPTAESKVPPAPQASGVQHAEGHTACPSQAGPNRTRTRTRTRTGSQETMPGAAPRPPFPPHVTGGAERGSRFKGQRGARPLQLRVRERRGRRR